MNVAIGWTLAVLSVAVGYARYGWKGVVLAVTVIVFWLLLQFSRSLRVLRGAAGRPVGVIDNAVMLHARLHAGMRLVEILRLTHSLGRKVADNPETFAWGDAEGCEVRAEFRAGRLAASRLVRPPGDDNHGGCGMSA